MCLELTQQGACVQPDPENSGLRLLLLQPGEAHSVCLLPPFSEVLDDAEDEPLPPPLLLLL